LFDFRLLQQYLPKTGLMHCSKKDRYSITFSVWAGSAGGTVMLSAGTCWIRSAIPAQSPIQQRLEDTPLQCAAVARGQIKNGRLYLESDAFRSGQIPQNRVKPVT
jgi:hypothetical protein